MPNISNTLPTDDLGVEATALSNRKARALMMLKQAMSEGAPMHDAGGFKVANWGDAIAKMIHSGVANYSLNKMEGEEKDLAGKMHERRNRDMGDFYNTAKGDYKAPATPNDDDGNANPGTGTKGDMLAALTRAMTSSDPDVRNMGIKGLEKSNEYQVEGAIRPKEALAAAPHISPNSPILQGIGVEQRARETQHDGVIASTTTDAQGNPVVKTAAANHYAPTVQNNVPGTQNLDTGNFVGTTGGNTSTVSKSVATELGTDAVKDLVKRASESYGKIVPGISDAQYFPDAFKLLDKAVTGAPWSSLDLSVRKGLETMGIVPDAGNRIPATEMVASIMSQKALALLQALRPASDPDRVYAEKLAGSGQITDPRTAKQLVSMAYSGFANDIMNHQKTIGSLDNWKDNKELQPLVDPLKKQYELPGFSLKMPPEMGIEGGPQEDGSSRPWKVNLNAGPAAGGAAKKPLRFDQNGNLIQ